MAEPVQRGWMPYAQAAKQYLGIDKSVLLAAIRANQLPAYEKPITRGRTSNTKEHHSYFVSLDDVDTYIRTYWPRAFAKEIT